MGFTPVIYAFVVAFLAGTARSPIRVFVTGIIVALIEQYSSIWLSARWTQTAVFVVLVAYLSVLAFRASSYSTRLRRLVPAGKARGHAARGARPLPRAPLPHPRASAPP